jgi:hypothetical protein
MEYCPICASTMTVNDMTSTTEEPICTTQNCSDMEALKKVYPIEFKTSYFKQYETQENSNLNYVIYTTVNDDREETNFYQGLDHEANIKIEIL